TVGADAGVDLDDPSGTEVGPGKLFLAGPDQLHWLAGGLGEAGRLDGRLARLLAAVAGAGGGGDDADLVRAQAECLGEIVLHAERGLHTGPDGGLTVRPFSHRRSRLQRDVRDVSDRVSRGQLVRRRGQPVVDRAA